MNKVGIGASGGQTSPAASLDALDLEAIEKAATANDVLEIELTVVYAQHLLETQYSELYQVLSDNVHTRIQILPNSSTLLVAHIGHCRM